MSEINELTKRLNDWYKEFSTLSVPEQFVCMNFVKNKDSKMNYEKINSLATEYEKISSDLKQFSMADDLYS